MSSTVIFLPSTAIFDGAMFHIVSLTVKNVGLTFMSACIWSLPGYFLNVDVRSICPE